VAALNRLELAGESVRAALEALAAPHDPELTTRIIIGPQTSDRPDNRQRLTGNIGRRGGEPPADLVIGNIWDFKIATAVRK